MSSYKNHKPNGNNAVASNDVQEEKTENNINEFILNNPITWDGKEYKKFNFDVENLTGRDLIELQTDMKYDSIPLVSDMSIDEAYLSRLAAKSAGVDYEVIVSLKFKDYRRMIRKMSGLAL